MSRFFSINLLMICAFLHLLAPPAAACGASDTDCVVRSGNYRIYLPDNLDGDRPAGAVLFFHGWKGSSEGVMRNTNLQAMSDRHGIALIAANGLRGGWSFPGAPARARNELAYVGEVLDDVQARFHVPRDKILASGFSLGASMVWSLSCYMGDRFAGFVPVAGTLWNPLPETCPSGTPNLMHYHGQKDGTFPLIGRAIAGGLYRQGNTYKSFDIWHSQGQCEKEEPEILETEPFRCERRLRCGSSVLELCVHEGGHIYRAAWIERSWEILSGLKGW
ncbi:MAG: polyhydroxybutyrate depolymerase [Parvibaculaceae bacterium]|nr:polyhydroxybutyrate depolymerase [Parvibaculaceae bacterium]HBM88774.1 polyhydroxybutyrate depolymerase [Rhodobiaceae bacterium]